MIRRAYAADIPDGGADESLIRIASLKLTYGCDAPFIQFFTDENNGYLSVMDGVGVLYVPVLTDEWRIFLQMYPDLHTLHCPSEMGDTLLSDGGWQGSGGAVMRYNGDIPVEELVVCTVPHLPTVYALLSETFPNMPTFNSWYPDASHRVRHGHAHIGCVLEEGAVISTAMTVAETPTEAIIGQVATNASHRRKGLAGQCIKSVITQCKGKTLYILPLHEAAARLYREMGFIECGRWAELHKIY